MLKQRSGSFQNCRSSFAFVFALCFAVLTSHVRGEDHPERLNPLLACYGIEIEVLSSTNDPPIARITGTEGQGKEYILEHTRTHSWNKGTKDYFLIPAEKIGNVGVPTSVSFKATGSDDVRFKVLTVDYFAKAGWNMTYLCEAKDNLNRRDQVLHNENPRKLHDARVAYVPINQSCALDTDDVFAEGIRHTDKVVVLSAPVTSSQIAKISAASGGWIDVPMNSISSIALVSSNSKVKTTLGSSVEGRLLTSAGEATTSASSTTKSIEAQYKSKSDFHEASVTVGLSRTQSESVTKAVTSEMEKTVAETNSWEIESPCPDTADGYVRFAITEDYMRVRRNPRSVEVGGKVLYFQERRYYGGVSYSVPYKVKSAELKKEWARYTRGIASGKYKGVVLSEIQRELYVGD